MKLRNFTSAPVCVCVCVCVRACVRVRGCDGHNFASHHLGAGNVSCPSVRSPPAPVSTDQSHGMRSVCFHCLGAMRVLGVYQSRGFQEAALSLNFLIPAGRPVSKL